MGTSSKQHDHWSLTPTLTYFSSWPTVVSFSEDSLHIHNVKKHLHKQAYNPLFPSLLLLLFATACCLLSLPLSHLTASPSIPTSSSHAHTYLVAIYHPRSLLLNYETRASWNIHPPRQPLNSHHHETTSTTKSPRPSPPPPPSHPYPPLSNSQNPPYGVPHSLPLCRQPPALPPPITCTSSVYL